jgi:putative dehydrogenase
MGTAITWRLIGADFEVLAYDLDADKRAAIAAVGAKPEATAGVVIAGCEINVVAVFNTDQVEAVIAGPGGGLDAIAQGGTGARIFVVTSTCDPDRLAALAQRVAPEGAHVVEMPVSGTSRQVANGDGVALVAGDSATVERAAAVIDAICPRRH